MLLAAMVVLGSGVAYAATVPPHTPQPIPPTHPPPHSPPTGASASGHPVDKDDSLLAEGEADGLLGPWIGDADEPTRRRWNGPVVVYSL